MQCTKQLVKCILPLDKIVQIDFNTAQKGSAPRQLTHTGKPPLQVHFNDGLPTQKANVSWGEGREGGGLLFYTRNSPVLCIYFLKSAGVRTFPLLGSPAQLWSISGRSDLEHVLLTGRIHCSCSTAHPSLLQAPGLQLQGSASAWCRNILHDQNTTITTFVKLQG